MDQPSDVTWTQRAYLSFTRQGDHGDPPYTPSQLDEMAFDPDQITELVGLIPTSTWRRGDPSPYRQGPATRNFANWLSSAGFGGGCDYPLGR
ncbi:DUF4279 domain-containing protein [Cryptosporangium minutisporangium]|uniref:DUF4279 domain-containing protein n=2 Tax=Cryptosporangium minutisporangium TaxID=113569 RepID=UPI0035E8F341